MTGYSEQVYEGMCRFLPGSDQSALHASQLLPRSKPLRVLDVGCGMGAHTLALARELPDAVFTALDKNAKNLAALHAFAQTQGTAGRIELVCGSQLSPDFAEQSFDAVWIENAAHVFGYERSLLHWKPYLKPDGLLICRDLTWLTQPDEAYSNAWQELYS